MVQLALFPVVTLTKIERIRDALTDQPITAPDLAQQLGISEQETTARLIVLRLLGIAQEASPNHFSKAVKAVTNAA